MWFMWRSCSGWLSQVHIHICVNDDIINTPLKYSIITISPFYVSFYLSKSVATTLDTCIFSLLCEVYLHLFHCGIISICN